MNIFKSHTSAGGGIQKRPPWQFLLILLGILLLAFAVVGCEAEKATPPEDLQPVADVVTEEPPAPTDLPPEPTPLPPTPAPTPLPDQSEFQAAWKDGVHGSTYGLGKGPNTYCSRCHSPQNWDPASLPDKAPNCITCKFPTDPEVRQATTMSFVEEKDWKGIGCETCHKMENGVATEGVAWLNSITMEYEPVATTTELCGKCHATTQGVQASGGRGVDHAIVVGGSAHLNWAGALPQGHRPSECTDCHNPHSGEPAQCVDCHPDVLTSDTHMKGQNAAHENVSCLACHDASGLEVGPDPAAESDPMWTTVLNSVDRSGNPTSEAVVSHSIKWEVACDRCHFADNPWELSVLDAAGAPPTE